eukprot:4600000-Pyramimonas_sp.AAC.1
MQGGREDNRAASPAASCPVEGPPSSRLSVVPGAEGVRGEGTCVVPSNDVQRPSHGRTAPRLFSPR